MFKINKGVDRPPEVMGVRGMNFLQLLAGGVVGGLLVTTVLIAAFGLSSMYTFSTFIVLVFFLFHTVVRYSKKYGEKGYARYLANLRVPRVVTVRSSKVFRLLGEPIVVNKRRES